MSLPQKSDLILVAYMPMPHDMKIARVLGLYRIPLPTAPTEVIGALFGIKEISPEFHNRED